GRAWRFGSAPGRDPWTQQALTADGGKVAKLSHWAFRKPVDAAPAPFIQEPPPDLSLTRQPDGSLRLHAAPPPGGRTLLLQLNPDTPTFIEQLSGAPAHLALKPGHETMVQWAAASLGFDVVLRPGGPGKLRVGYVALLEAWPAAARPLPPRPPGLMAWDTSDSTWLTG